ncbi:thermonuclease family protein [Pseudomonas taiwanensis]|uniref:thermonuclease family protein n=1 Tax=Pseudomonas taiwanensis TaxID=470150 RepID=UPI0028DFEDB7|nr:thermonuclease family protein [Pseudomonas taiwanensis]MDT8924938.1 thermonuclease family protein [Pseudomonas taiwanensis]
MLKVLSFLMAAMLPTIVCADMATSDRGAWRPFADEFIFEGTVIEADKDLTFWVEPDPRFTDLVRKKADEMSTAYVVRRPLLLRIKLAGIESGEEGGIALSHDEFDENAQADIRQTLLNGNYQLRCYGNYANYVIPFCSAIDLQGRSMAVKLIEKGLVRREESFLGITELEHQMMKDAQKAAQDQGVGIWKPFRVMFRGLK